LWTWPITEFKRAGVFSVCPYQFTQTPGRHSPDPWRARRSFKRAVKFFRNIRLLRCIPEVGRKDGAAAASYIRHGDVTFVSIPGGTLPAT
jgi:hypothetical protein